VDIWLAPGWVCSLDVEGPWYEADKARGGKLTVLVRIQGHQGVFRVLSHPGTL